MNYRLAVLAVVFAATAIIQAVVGYYGFEQRGHTVAAIICYLTAVAAVGLALRCWGRRNYYP